MALFVTGAYAASALLFLRAVAGSCKLETARRGDAFGMAGAGLALVATLVRMLDYVSDDSADQGQVAVGLLTILVAGTVGAAIGTWLAVRSARPDDLTHCRDRHGARTLGP